MRRTRSEATTSTAQWWLPLTLAGLGGLGWACQDGGGSGADGGTDGEPIGDGQVSRRDVLQSVATRVVAPSTAEFSETAAALETATRTYADAAEAEPNAAEAERSAAQQAWRDAMAQWQVLEVMQIGPAAPSLQGLGGEDLRDEIYSWPTTDTCSVDRALADGSYAADDFFATQLVWAYGLDALEYLLFAPDGAHTCPPQVQLDGPWMALGADERARRRAAYADVVATEVARQASILASRWSADGDDFAAALAMPAQGASPYAGDTEALDDVFRAMFYIDKQTKDGKLGLPLGLIDGCAAAPCGDAMESPWGGVSASSIAANLRALQWMVQGGREPEDGIGFDELLDAAGEGAIAGTLSAQITAAIEVAESFDVPLQQAIADDPARVQMLHAAVREATTTLKGPFVMALMLTIPAEGAGDND